MSSRLLSVTGGPKSRSRTNKFVLTRPLASLQMRAVALSTAHIFPEPQPVHKLHDGGHESQVDGHIGRSEQKWAEEGAIVVGEARETIVVRITAEMFYLTQNCSAHEQELSHDRSTTRRGLDPCGGVPLEKRRRGNQTADCSARIHPGHRVVGAPRARGNPMMEARNLPGFS